MAPTGVVSVKSPEAFRTISEVAVMLDVPQHVLRFWETRFSQIKPIKRAGGRRFYRPEDVDLLRGIQLLLYFEGYTIRGAQKILREKGVRYTAALGRGQMNNGHAVTAPPEESPPAPDEQDFAMFAEEPDTQEDATEIFDAVGTPAGALECGLEEPIGQSDEPAHLPDLVFRAAKVLSGASPRRARLESLRDELLQLKSRLAAARQNVTT
jgi:DNA-binding transcriptional MerR regulator